MKYHIQFQEMSKGASRPIDRRSASDHTIESPAVIPNVGDYVQIEPFGDQDAPRYSGKVRSRLFRYMGADDCGVNIVIESAHEYDWGKLIKE